MKKLVLGMMLGILSLAMAQQVACNLNLDRRNLNQKSVPQVFRLLVVEAVESGGDRLQSGQYFIRKLMQYPNWNNVTCVSYVHLLSRYTKDEVINECKTSVIGISTKANMRDEILGFLGNASSNEIAVLYYDGDGLPLELYLDEITTADELSNWLGTVKCPLCIILDACHAGSFASDGQASMLRSQRMVLCSSRSNQLSWGSLYLYEGSFFTGFEDICYPNGTSRPVGLIGSTIAAVDVNNDGWLSVQECFAYAKTSTEQLTTQLGQAYIMNPVYFNGLGFDPPLIQLPSLAHDVAVTGIQCRNVTSNSTSTPIRVTVPNQGDTPEIFNVTLYINNTSVETQTVNNLPNGSSTDLTFTWNTTGLDHGNYNITAYAWPVPGETDTADNNSTSWVTVTIPGDIDGNFAVQLNDLVLLARAYSSRVGDSNWNPNADIDGNGTVGLSDLVILAQRYGQHYP